ncbi:MAG: shikimate kinase [Rickettsiales bacterium]
MKKRLNKTICLVGMPGAGKTTIGKVLAKKLLVKFYDTDELIEQKTNMKISEIFNVKGEGFFRNLEHEIVKEVLENNKDFILSVGGGCYINFYIKNLLDSQCETVFLDVNVMELKSRLVNSNQRPLIKNDNINHLYKSRINKYLEAKYKVISTNKSVDEIADEIINLVSLDEHV